MIAIVESFIRGTFGVRHGREAFVFGHACQDRDHSVASDSISDTLLEPLLPRYMMNSSTNGLLRSSEPV